MFKYFIFQEGHVDATRSPISKARWYIDGGRPGPDNSICAGNNIPDNFVVANSLIDAIEIFNILGQSVISLNPGVLETKVDMQTLQTGAYFVKISIDQKTETFRVLKN